MGTSALPGLRVSAFVIGTLPPRLDTPYLLHLILPTLHLMLPTFYMSYSLLFTRHTPYVLHLIFPTFTLLTPYVLYLNIPYL